MNDERMPINIYKLDAGYNDKGMNSNELIKDYKRNIHKWYFIAAVDIVFALIIAFVNFKVPDTVMMSLIIYIVVLALLIVSIVRIHGYRLQCRSIQGDLTDEKYKLSTRISVYIAVILSLAMSGLTIRSLIVKRNVHSVSVTLYGIVFVLLLVMSAVSLIVYIYKSKIGIYVSIACLVIIFAYGIIMKDSPLQLIIIFLPVIYAMFSTRE